MLHTLAPFIEKVYAVEPNNPRALSADLLADIAKKYVKQVEAFGDDAAKIEAKLASTSVDGDQMDALVARLGALHCVDQAYWSPSTTE